MIPLATDSLATLLPDIIRQAEGIDLSGFNLKIPLEVEVAVGRSWGLWRSGTAVDGGTIPCSTVPPVASTSRAHAACTAITAENNVLSTPSLTPGLRVGTSRRGVAR